MSWTGTWRNQYGSIVEVTDERDGIIRGWFETALTDSGFHGTRAEILGVHRGDCIAFSATARGPAGDMVVSYTGLLRDGRMETLWHFVADAAVTANPGEPGKVTKTPWWRATLTSADTFERIAGGG